MLLKATFVKTYNDKADTHCPSLVMSVVLGWSHITLRVLMFCSILEPCDGLIVLPESNWATADLQLRGGGPSEEGQRARSQ